MVRHRELIGVSVSYCVECGGVLVEQVPPGDDRSRLVCASCDQITYINPKVVVGALPVVNGKVLL
ncbi:MAG: zinc ribbon domain-containing protein, partial [Chloroflexota bacterium]